MQRKYLKFLWFVSVWNKRADYNRFPMCNFSLSCVVMAKTIIVRCSVTTNQSRVSRSTRTNESAPVLCEEDAEWWYSYCRTLTGLAVQCSLTSADRPASQHLPIYCRIRKPDCSARQVLVFSRLPLAFLPDLPTLCRIVKRQKPQISNHKTRTKDRNKTSPYKLLR